MFFIEPLVWMFKTKDFKKHFKYLIFITFICWILSIIVLQFNFDAIQLFSFELNLLFQLISAILFIVPLLMTAGYFWCLTDNAINRKIITRSGSIYTGSIELGNQITLPDFMPKHFIWRGFASIIATIIMYIPLTTIYLAATNDVNNVISFWNISYEYTNVVFVVITIFFSIFVPALLWNYARRDSVLAMLNLPKAIYIIESYPAKYFKNMILFLIFSLLHFYIIKLMLSILSVDTFLVFGNGIPIVQTSILETSFVNLVVFLFFGYITELYFVFINSYLLGTIAPPSEW